ncbi:MAG: PDGLE domain-containing protein [Candidatus Omnitrophota bacterium]|jgi:hypothetical protein
MKTTVKLWIGIGLLALLSPLGLFMPEYFRAGDAWGEWGMDTLKELAGYIPRGLERLADTWSAPMPDYAFKGWEEKGLSSLSFAYIISALTGIIAVVLIVMLIGRILLKKKG